jgi:hypothetical protein
MERLLCNCIRLDRMPSGQGLFAVFRANASTLKGH